MFSNEHRRFSERKKNKTKSLHRKNQIRNPIVLRAHTRLERCISSNAINKNKETAQHTHTERLYGDEVRERPGHSRGRTDSDVVLLLRNSNRSATLVHVRLTIRDARVHPATHWQVPKGQRRVPEKFALGTEEKNDAVVRRRFLSCRWHLVFSLCFDRHPLFHRWSVGFIKIKASIKI